MPITNPIAQIMYQAGGVKKVGNQAVRKWKDRTPKAVPTVPGTIGERPLPNPSEIRCHGFESMKENVGVVPCFFFIFSGLRNGQKTGYCLDARFQKHCKV